MWPDDMISNGWLWRTPVSKAPISLWWIYGRWAFSWNWRRHKFVISCIMDVMAELEKTQTGFHFIMAWVSVWDIDDGGSFLPDVDAYSLFEWILSWDRWAWMCGLQTFFLHHNIKLHAGPFVMVVDGKCSFSRVKCRPLHAAIQKINLHERLFEFNIPTDE